MTTKYMGRPSPYQLHKRFDAKAQPVRDEARKLFGTYTLTATFEEDVQTARHKYAAAEMGITSTLHE